MTDRSRSDPDVATHLATWLDREACIDALAEALKDAAAEQDEMARDILTLTTALRDVCAEKAGLEMRLRHALERERLLLDRRRYDLRGLLAIALDWLRMPSRTQE